MALAVGKALILELPSLGARQELRLLLLGLLCCSLTHGPFSVRRRAEMKSRHDEIRRKYGTVAPAGVFH